MDMRIPISAMLPMRWRIILMLGGLLVLLLTLGIGTLLTLAALFRWICGFGANG